jgi:HAE1 family hydrophobic/amphiphilic exporter-1
MFTVPFAYLGMFIAIRLTGTTFSIFGLLAGITLVGFVVNAAILLIDDLRERNENGIHGVEAVMQTSRAKFRPILMSCGAALFGMLPMAISGGMGSELRTSMGIGSVGGMALSSLVSLYLIPVMCAVRKH